MKLIIFGATGSIGTHLVKQAIDQDFAITTFTRNTAKLNMNHSNLKTFRGEVLNSNTVVSAIQNHDAVICALGAGRKGKIRAEGTRNIISAMESTGIRRIICLSTLGAGESRGNLNFFWKQIMFGLLLKKAYLDHQEQEKIIRQSNLDWTIVRPGAFTDGGLTGNYRHGFTAAEKGLKLKISRADVAHFMLNQLMDDRYLHKAAGISY